VKRGKAGPGSRSRRERHPAGSSGRSARKRPAAEIPTSIEFKPSVYNHRLAFPDGDILYFNFYTLNLISLPPKEAAEADRLLLKPTGIPGTVPPGLPTLMIEKGFLVDSRVDETDLLRKAREQARSRPGSLALTILPTLACNFRCVYCYETHGSQTMGPETQALPQRAICR